MLRRALPLLLPAMFACSGGSSSVDLPPPSLNGLLVYYPLDGLARGRGLPGTLPTNAPYVRIRSHPQNGETIATVDPDGSFQFGVIAFAGDLIEISASRDKDAQTVGEPVFVRVPPSASAPTRYYCCSTGTCQSEHDLAQGVVCESPSNPIATQCESDADCGVLERQYLTLELQKINVTPPNAEGYVDITGQVQPDALVAVENRGLSSLCSPPAGLTAADLEAYRADCVREGYVHPGIKRYAVASDTGAFRITRVPAAGDDELVLRIFDLTNFSSPPAALRVPDAPLTGLDILGAFAWEPLSNNARGIIALYLAPFGVDAKGLCPNSPEDPQVCFSGGLTHGMVDITSVQFGDSGNKFPGNPAVTATSAANPHNRGVSGNIRVGPQDIVVVLDFTPEAAAADPENTRLTALREFVRGLRARDRVAVIPFGLASVPVDSRSPSDPGLRVFDERQGLLDAASSFAGRSGDVGDIYTGIRAAANALKTARSGRGRVVVITTTEPAAGLDTDSDMDGTVDIDEEEDTTLVAVIYNSVTGEKYPVDVIAANVPPTGKYDYLSSFAGFTGGYFYESSFEALNQTLTDLRGQLSGAFILLYDMTIPEEAGKSTNIDLSVQVRIGAERASANYSGPLRVINSVRP